MVSGSDKDGQVFGSLVGQIVETPDSFASFLATRRITRGGIVTWRGPVEFHGKVNGVDGQLRLDGMFLYRFKPGTTWYDFNGPLYQPGTTGDPAAWISGGSLYRVTGLPGDLAGASGILHFTETTFLSEHTYRGVIRV